VKCQSHFSESRTTERIYQSFLISVGGKFESGVKFKIDTVLDDLSSGGLYLRLPERVRPGTRLFAVVRISTVPDVRAPRIAVVGVVTRSEPLPGGAWGLGVAFKRHRFL
jgi:hypothetical protein